MSKNLLEIFNRYTPDDEAREILLMADPDSVKLRADKPQRMIEVSASFPSIVPRSRFYRIEEAIKAAYDLNAVFLCPRFPSHLFGKDCIPDLLTETNRRGIVAKGFFDHCSYRLLEGVLEIEIPFTESGVGLIYDAKTPQLMEELLQQTYGVRLTVQIRQMQNGEALSYQNAMRSQMQ